MIKAFEPRYQVPHRKTFTEKILPEHFIKVKSTVTSAAYKANFFAITTDCWTSRATEAYMGVTFNTISDDWELVHFTLQNKALPDKHTAENLADALLTSLQQWNLDPSRLSCVS